MGGRAASKRTRAQGRVPSEGREAGDLRAYQQFLTARTACKEYSRAGNARARARYQAALAVTPGFVAALAAAAVLPKPSR